MKERHIVIRAIEQRDAATLEALQIRGAWDARGNFTGYDYHNQRWIEHLAGMAAATFAAGAL